MLNKKVLKEMDGVTLISLVVTIVVMFIIIGITSIAAFGDKGVMNKAKTAKKASQEKEAKEKLNLQVESCYDQLGVIDLDRLTKNLSENLDGVLVKPEGNNQYAPVSAENPIGSLPITVKYNDIEVEINGTCYLSDIAQDARTYGKYVNYPIDIDGDGSTEQDWKIFYGDEEGNVYIIASDFVKIKAYDTDDSKGYCDGMYEALKKCGFIDDSGNPDITKYTARWGTSTPPLNAYTSNKYADDYYSLSDIQSLFKYNMYQNGGGCVLSEQNPSKQNQAAVLMFLNPKIWDFLVVDKYASYAIAGPTIDLWVNSWNKHSDRYRYSELSCQGFDEDGYCIGLAKNGTGARVTPTEGEYSLQGVGGSRDTLYFSHDEVLEDECYGYWLAAPSKSNSGNNLMTVEYTGKIENREYNIYNNQETQGFRPVVCIRKGMKVEEVTDTILDDTYNEKTINYYNLQ